MKYALLIVALICFGFFLNSCVTGDAYNKTVAKVDIEKFMGTWYVIASRPTFMEDGAHNAVETYTLAENGVDIDIDFRFNKDSFDGEIKTLPQSGEIYNMDTKAHWKVSPFWPLSFDFLIIAMDPDYKWSVIGVPNQKYLWLLGRTPQMTDEEVDSILNDIKALGYNVDKVDRVPHNG